MSVSLRDKAQQLLAEFMDVPCMDVPCMDVPCMGQQWCIANADAVRDALMVTPSGCVTWIDIDEYNFLICHTMKSVLEADMACAEEMCGSLAPIQEVTLPGGLVLFFSLAGDTPFEPG